MLPRHGCGSFERHGSFQHVRVRACAQLPLEFGQVHAALVVQSSIAGLMAGTGRDDNTPVGDMLVGALRSRAVCVKMC